MERPWQERWKWAVIIGMREDHSVSFEVGWPGGREERLISYILCGGEAPWLRPRCCGNQFPP